jgi:two-component sensor histidine kinase
MELRCKIADFLVIRKVNKNNTSNHNYKTQIIPGFREMKLNPFTLSFLNKETEHDFEDDFYKKSLIQVRISFILAIFLYTIFGFIDEPTILIERNIISLIRFMVILPIGLLVIISSYSYDFKKFKDISFAFSMILFGIGIIAMQVISSNPMDFSYHAALILTFIFVHVFVSIRFIPATITGFIILLLYEFAAIFIMKSSEDIIWKSNYYFISAIILGMFSSYAIEFYARRDFFIALEMQKKQEELNVANSDLAEKIKESTQQLVEANKELTKEIEERKNAQQKISESLFEKEVLLKEIHHRVKNNMQVISSLMFLQSEIIDDEKVKQIFEENQQRIKSMSLIHEKLYQARNLSKIDFGEYVSSLLENIFIMYNCYHRIECEQQLHNIHLDINTAVPLGLLLNELITNAIKHGFSKTDKGLVRIELTETTDTNLHLIVFNNGIPFPENIDINRTDTFGLQLVNILVEQLNGKMKLKREEGSTFEIDIERYITQMEDN